MTDTDRAARIRLLPWDPNSEAHYRRMYEQRLACGWKEELLPQWKETVLSGKRCFFWIILAENDQPGRDEMLDRHFDKYEKEREPLVDTASVFNGGRREATQANFHPIGHVALQREPELDTVTGLDTSKTLWVMSLYVSWALHGTGLGRAAMAAIEQVAAGPPFGATTLALDTITSECQALMRANAEVYDGRDRPADAKTIEEWYDKQGYESFYRTPEDQCYRMTNPATGESKVVWQVCKKKRLGL